MRAAKERQARPSRSLSLNPTGTFLHRQLAHFVTAIDRQFVAHVEALPGKPHDGHTLEKLFPNIEAQICGTIRRIVADKGYRGHNAPEKYRARVYFFGQKRGVTAAIKRDLRRQSAVEPVNGHLKEDHGMDRNHLKGSTGDAINAILAAAGYNFRWLIT